jgi:hypothetical protein
MCSYFLPDTPARRASISAFCAVRGSLWEVREAGPCLNKCHKALDEPGGWGTVNNVVIKAHGQAEVLPVLQLAVVKDRPGVNAANRDAKRVGHEWDPPAGSAPKHADRGDDDRAIEPLYGRR